MARRSASFKINKRKKELLRQRKQEEKRLRRQKKDTYPVKEEIEEPGNSGHADETGDSNEGPENG